MNPLLDPRIPRDPRRLSLSHIAILSGVGTYHDNIRYFGNRFCFQRKSRYLSIRNHAELVGIE